MPMPDTTVRSTLPDWWSTATTIRVFYLNSSGTSVTADVAPGDVELLSEGVSFVLALTTNGRLIPWNRVIQIEKQA